MDNKTVAKILNEIALLLELSGENPFKIRAYAEGARIIESQDLPVSELVRSQTLSRIKGIGTTLSRQITQLVQEGSIPLHEELKAAFPEGVREMLQVPGLGPKKVKELFDKLGIKSIGELEYACHENRLLTLPGFGRKSRKRSSRALNNSKNFRAGFCSGGCTPWP
jgi:DNA polymerase (family 10)